MGCDGGGGGVFGGFLKKAPKPQKTFSQEFLLVIVPNDYAFATTAYNLIYQ